MIEKITAVQRMQDYIAEHLTEKITAEDIAKISFFSPSHSVRLFKELTGLSPADYIRRLKLSKSALELRDFNRKIIDVALDMGFDSVDGYQRAFRHEFGCNPKEYAKRPVPIYLFTPYRVENKEKEVAPMDDVKNVFIQVIEKPARKVIIKRGIEADDYFSYCNEVGCDVWGLLRSIKSISGEPLCLWLPEKYIKAGTSKYVQGVEVSEDYDGIIPDGFDVIDLPSSKYLMFQSDPFKDEDYQSAIECIWNAEAKYNPSFIGYSYDDENPRIQLEPIGSRGYIEFIAVK